MATEKKSFISLGKIEAIRQLFEGTSFRPFEEPCFFSSENKEYITTATKTLLEGTDFNLTYFPLKHLGYKSVCAVTGELLAVLSTPATLSVVLGVSSKLDFKHIKDLWCGMVAAAKEFGYKSLSLDLKPSLNGLAINISATGAESEEFAALRPKAESKDLVCISGSLGAAYLGQQVLEKKFDRIENYKMFVGAYLKPELSVDIIHRFREAGICPSFGYFVTNGLADAALRLSRDSKLGVKIYADRIPFEGNSFALGKELDIDPVSAAMNGGDDCHLMFTVPILQAERFRKEFQTFDIIGHLALPEAGCSLVTPEGVELPVRAQGWKIEN